MIPIISRNCFRDVVFRLEITMVDFQLVNDCSKKKKKKRKLPLDTSTARNAGKYAFTNRFVK